MHIVVGRISAVYLGRGETELAPYDRIVIHKADGTVSIHADKGFKPMNYMASASTKKEYFVDDELVWEFTAGKESLVITFHRIYDEINLELGTADPGHSDRQGTEKQLQDWLALHIHELDPTLEFVSKEYPTGDGPVDLLARRGEVLVPVEIKRVAPMTTVSQVLRYGDAIRDHRPDANVECVIAAVEFKGNTAALARKRGVECLLIPSDWNDSEAHPKEAPARTLFDLGMFL